MKNVLKEMALFAVLVFSSACAAVPAATSSPAVTSPLPAQVSPLPQTPMSENANMSPARAAIAALAKQLSIDPQNIRVVSIEEVEWPDGCLGIPQPDRMCTQAIVPGYRVMLEVNGKQYEARTTLNARQAAIVPQS